MIDNKQKLDRVRKNDDNRLKLYMGSADFINFCCHIELVFEVLLKDSRQLQLTTRHFINKSEGLALSKVLKIKR